MKSLLILALFFSSATFAQTSPEEKQIAELEKKILEKKAALAKINADKGAALKRIEEQQKELAEQEARLKAEMAQPAVATSTQVTSELTVRAQPMFTRDWFFDAGSALDIYFGNKYKPDGGTERTRDRHAINVEGGRNFGRFEVAPRIFYARFDFESYDGSESSLGLTFTYNIIENQPGTSLVPFVDTGVVSGKYSDNSGANGESDEYTTITVATGVKYFPFGELVALKARAYYYVRDGEIDSGSKFDYKTSGLRFDGGFYIYF